VVISYLVELTPSAYGLFLVLILAIGFYVSALFKRVDYTSNMIEELNLNEIPENIRRLIIKTSARGKFVNQAMLKSLSQNDGLSLTQLHERLRRQGIKLTPPAERVYAEKLEKADLLRIEGTPKERSLVLTDVGVWTRDAIEKVFPEWYYLFVYRNKLGVRSIPPFPTSLPLADRTEPIVSRKNDS
jgi:hypothetical protein